MSRLSNSSSYGSVTVSNQQAAEALPPQWLSISDYGKDARVTHRGIIDGVEIVFQSLELKDEFKDQFLVWLGGPEADAFVLSKPNFEIFLKVCQAGSRFAGPQEMPLDLPWPG